MNILALDTGSLSGTIIGASAGEGKRAELHLSRDKSQERMLLTCVDLLLKSLDAEIADIDLFAVTVGPGSFTGLRIGISTVKGLAFALGKPALGISNLEALAYGSRDLAGDALLVPVIDARMGRVFSAFFREGRRLTPDLDSTPEELAKFLETRPEKSIFLTGDALIQYPSIGDSLAGKTQARHPGGKVTGLSLVSIAENRCSEAGDAAYLDAVYLRKAEAEARWEEAANRN